MFGNWFGRKDVTARSAPFYRPYRHDAADLIYNLLFCDNVSLFDNGTDRKGELGVVLSESVDRDTLDRIGNDLDVESRTRALAFNRLRAMKASVPPKRLLGTIIEMPLHGGLDTLAIYLDHRVRYINHTGKMAIFESAPASLVPGLDDVLRSRLAFGYLGQHCVPHPNGAIVHRSVGDEHDRIVRIVADEAR